MDILLPLYQLMYFILHFMYSLFQAVLNCCIELRSYVRQQFWWNTYYNPSMCTLMTDAAEMKKVPTHLVFLLVSSQVNNFRQICCAINWGIAYGIQYFTFYDYLGRLKKDVASIIDAIPNFHENVTFKVCVDGHQYIFNEKTLLSSDEFRKDNNNDKLEIILNIFSNEDGKENIVSVAQKICSKSFYKISNESISSMLVANEQPDPDFAIVLGKPLMTCGLLPWQIRLTEFVSISSVSLLDYKSFKMLLASYAKCEKRFGR